MLRLILLLLIFSPEYITDLEIVNHLPVNADKVIVGKASYYDYKIGDWSSVGHLVCATRDFFRYSEVKITNLDNGKSVIARVTDYGPDYSVFPDRVVDLSSTAFAKIADTRLGVINVKVEYNAR